MGRLISDMMSYRNHYMCSGEATSIYIYIASVLIIFDTTKMLFNLAVDF